MDSLAILYAIEVQSTGPGGPMHRPAGAGWNGSDELALSLHLCVQLLRSPPLRMIKAS